MTDAYVTSAETHPLPTLISWPAILAGAAAAVAVGAMLNLLGVALGAGTFNPFDLVRDDEARTFTVAAGVWVAVANAMALFFGAVVASRAAKYADNHAGMLHGLLVWAVAFFAALLIAGWAGGSAADSAVATAKEVADTVPAASAAAARGAPLADGTFLQADGTVISGDGTVVGKQTPLAPTAAVAVAPSATPVAQKAAAATATVALWAFLAMLLGAIAAILGGRYGARRHGWETRLAARESAAHVAPRL